MVFVWCGVLSVISYIIGLGRVRVCCSLRFLSSRVCFVMLFPCRVALTLLCVVFDVILFIGVFSDLIYCPHSVIFLIQETIMSITEYSEAAITVRGTYFPPGQSPPLPPSLLSLSLSPSLPPSYSFIQPAILKSLVVFLPSFLPSLHLINLPMFHNLQANNPVKEKGRFIYILKVRLLWLLCSCVFQVIW